MARIPMRSGFSIIPEGVDIFLIYGVTYDEEFGKLEIYLVNAQNMTHIERFSLMNSNGEPNEKAMNAFSYFAKTALNQYDMEDIDPQDLVGHYIKAEVVHTKFESNKYPGRMNTFANFGNKEVAEGFENTPVKGVFERTLDDGKKPVQKAAKTPAPAPTSVSSADLDSLLD